MQDTARVDANAYVGPHAKVYGYAVVSGGVVVSGNATVCDDTSRRPRFWPHDILSPLRDALTRLAALDGEGASDGE